MEIQSKVAIVTGASRGVGRATALSLAHDGCDVVLNYRKSADEAEAAAVEVRALGVRAVTHAGDVADDAACRDLIETAAREFGRIDVLINNAGTTSFIPHDDLEAVGAPEWERIMSVNVIGPFQCVRAALPWLRKANGAVVNVASVAGIRNAGSSIPYGASKAALIKMTVDLARALGPKIRVNAVAPGFIAGEWLQSGLGEHYEAAKEAVANQSPLQRVSEPADVAQAIMSLVNGSDLVTGQTLVVDAGASLGPSMRPRP